MTMMYSPIGGWMDVIPGEVEDMRKKGWFTEDNENYVHPHYNRVTLAKQDESAIMGAQAAVQEKVKRRVGRPRKGS
jgi:hypothetical protein